MSSFLRNIDDYQRHITEGTKLNSCPTESYTSRFLVSWGGVRLSPLGTSVTHWPIVQTLMIEMTNVEQ
jgi:hypothetical protein